jgi:hypothetical protein
MTRGSKAGIALGAIVIVLVIGEIITRIVSDPPGYIPRNPRMDSLYAPNLTLAYSLRPGTHHYVTADDSVAIEVSSDGLRDTTIAAAKQAQLRILAVGNSFTTGLGVRADDTWCKQLEQILAERNRRRSVHVVNGGVPRFSPRQIRIREAMLTPVLQPQAIIYELTTQTFGRMYQPYVWFGVTLARLEDTPHLLITRDGLMYTPYHNKWMRKLDIWMNLHFQLGAHLLHRSIRRPDVLDESDTTKIRELMKPTLDELSASQSFATDNKTPFIVLLANPQLPDGHFSPLESVYNSIVTEHCRTHGIRCIDLLPALIRESGGRPIFRTPHDAHWTPAAHALAARVLADSLTLR